MKKLALLLTMLLLLTGCQQQGNEIVHFPDTDIHILGTWDVNVSGIVGSVKGTVYNGSLLTYENVEIRATVYDSHGIAIMSSNAKIPRLSPNIHHDFVIAKALGEDPNRKWERVEWDLNYTEAKLGFIEEVLSNMPVTQRQVWGNIIYSSDTFAVSLWPTIFNMDIQLANLAIQTGRTNDYDRSWFFRYPVSGPYWSPRAKAYALIHVTDLPEPFRSQEIQRLDKLPFPTGNPKQLEFWNKWATYVYVNTGYVQHFPSYEWRYDPKVAAEIYPRVADDLRLHCLQIIQQY